jgi:AbrB family looped-hinge helix DNA binding protein
MKAEATLTSKCQTSIPKEIRDTLGMKAGDRTTFTLQPPSIMRVKGKSITNIADARHKGRSHRTTTALMQFEHIKEIFLTLAKSIVQVADSRSHYLC